MNTYRIGILRNVKQVIVRFLFLVKITKKERIYKRYMLYKEDIMSYYITDTNELYQMIGYCEFPTVIMKNVLTGRTEHIVPDCLNANAFHKLVKEDADNE